MPSERIARSIREITQMVETFPPQGDKLAAFSLRLVEVFNQGGRLLLLGSGPLAAVADLVATRFLHRLSIERPSLPAFSFSHDSTLAAALARDGQSSQYLARQLRAATVGGDIVLAFADGGRDEAIHEALAAARQLDCMTALVTPEKEDAGGETPDFLFRLECETPARLAEGALVFGHLLCELVEGELFGI